VDTESDRAVGARRGYSSLFAFNFSAPPQMRVCDRLKTLAGTAKEFFGSIQLSFPTWEVEPWNPKERPCGVPEAAWLKANDIYNYPVTVQPKNIATLLRQMHSLVRLQSGTYEEETRDADDNVVTYVHTLKLHIAKHLGDKLPEKNPSGTPAYLITDEASNCDFNGDGKVDFATEPEKSCASTCDSDVDCAEFSNYKSRSQFQLVVEDSFLVKGAPAGTVPTRRAAKIQANGSASQGFRALAVRGQDIRAFTGTLGYFSGGVQFTVEARCNDDIVLDPNGTPKSSNEACIFPRTESELESQ
jgi:hypothetical protein